MVRLHFLGASGTVTGSRFVVETDHAAVLVDCGLFQGPAELRERNWARLRTPRRLDAVVLTHAHIDHSGWLPRLVREGYPGVVHCTHATAELAPILLADAAYLEEEDARRQSRRGEGEVSPLFIAEDAEEASARLRGHPWRVPVEVAEGVSVRFLRAGHILGAASVEITVEGQVIVFSGDVGRWGVPLMRDPEPPDHADIVVVESTYGDRVHPDVRAEDELADIVNAAVKRGGVLLLPSFAVGRTQELLYVLHKLEDQGRIPRLPVIVDSPMATDVTGLFCHFPDEFDPDVRAAIRDGSCPLSVKTSRTRFSRTPEESMALNALEGPAIIVSSAGMCTGGRILHHLKHRLPDPRTTVCFTGFMVEGTLGRRLLGGADVVRIHGIEVEVHAHRVQATALSAHADRRGLERWLRGLREPPARVYVVHGETGASAALAETIGSWGWSVEIPRHGEVVTLDGLSAERAR